MDRPLDRYVRDGAIVAGGAAAILLQVADPVVARGVAGHSAFATDPMRRLRHTLTFVYGALAGDARQRDRVAALTDRAHDGVPGARDAEHQLWVAATLYATGRAVQERLRGPLPPGLDGEILAASAMLGTVLQVPAERWPADRAAFDAYWRDAVAALEVGDDARAIARDLLHPRRAPWWMRAGMPLVRAVTPTLLPAPIAEAYGFALRDARVAWAILRALTRITPWRLRSLPARHLLAALG
ncbi:oxygenase MpaB family protein [Pseudolysinimonas sp.]|uniref:oxygenase MpaB family protein n=1 Tax=Pseudolysinimonas sp. TaxID=2680009 RepID=UPI003F811115